MKYIAIVITDMIVGGVEKALIEMLKRVDHVNYHWTVFTWDEKGALIDLLPEYVNIRYLKDGADTAKNIISDAKGLKLFSVLKGLVYRVIMRITKDNYKKQIYMEKCKRKINEKYDCAIAYKLNFSDTSCICYRMNAKKRCAFLHGNVTRQKQITKQFDKCSFYCKMDCIEKIFCVSEDVKKALIY